MFDIYSVFMTPSEQADYLANPTPATRVAFADSLGVRQRFLALPEGQQDEVLAQELVKGMSEDALLMSWGHPWRRYGLGGDDEEWDYRPYLSRHLPQSVGYRVYLRAGRVYEWIQYLIPAPEGRS
ncbi:MAG: hypothetical protein ACE5H5_04530 [Nitrospinota bacterium]